MNYFSDISSWLKVSTFLFIFFFFSGMAKKLIKSEWMFYHLIFIFFIHINMHSVCYWIPDRDTENLWNQVCLQFDIGIFPLKKILKRLIRKLYVLVGSKSSLQKSRDISLFLPRAASSIMDLGQSLSQLCKLRISTSLFPGGAYFWKSVRQPFG